MTTKIVVLTTDGPSREDGNVYYSNHILVSSDTLNFDEPVFGEDVITANNIEGIQNEDSEGGVDHAKLIAHIRSLGYTVEEPEAVIITTGS